MMRDHGGNLDMIRSARGGDDWIDLSTGINRVPYPLPPIRPEAWSALPLASARDALLRAAAKVYGTDAPMVALAGAQAAIQMLPLVAGKGLVRVLGPTYNEHAACFLASGWRVEEVGALSDLTGADVAVVVNPNNPDGRVHEPADLLALRGQVGILVVDESFADPVPGLSVAAHAGHGMVVLRSFGKFYGLAGVRLGFAIGNEGTIARLSTMAGPWPVAGPALEIGTVALTDTDWARVTTERLALEGPRIDALAQGAGWRCVGGTHLFRLYDTPDAAAAQERLATHRIWSRIFPWSPRLIRLGLPGMGGEWQRLATALS